MTIHFQVPRILQTPAGGKTELEFQATTVGELMAELKQRRPALHVCLCDESGKLRRHINLFLNDELFDRHAMETPLESGDVVAVFQAVSGG